MQNSSKKAYSDVYKELDQSRPVTEFDISFRIEDAEELSRGLDLLPDNPIGFEIGSHNGASDFFFCTYRPDLTLYSLDCDPRPKWILNMRGLRAVPLKGMSDTYSWDKPLDFLFIDGDHSYKWCKHDIERFSPFVKPGGVIAGHDYDIPTVKQVVDEILHDNPSYKSVAFGHSWVYQKI